MARSFSQKRKLYAAFKHAPSTDESQALTDAVDKLCTHCLKYEQRKISGNQQNGVVVPTGGSPKVMVHAGSVVNNLIVVAGETGLHSILFKLIALIKQRVDQVKLVDAKALLVKKQLENIQQCFDDMKVRFACSSSSPEEQKSILALREEEAVLLFAQCAKVLGSLTAKAFDRQLAGYKVWIDKVTRPFTRCFASPANLEGLDNYISKLEEFALDMTRENLSMTVNNDLPYLGEERAVGTRFCQSITDLKQFVSKPSSGHHISKVSVVHITGTAGAGKSRLAKEVLHRLFSEQEAGVNDVTTQLLQIDCSSSSDSHLYPVEWQGRLLEQMANGRAAEGLNLRNVDHTKIENVLRAWKDSGTGHKHKVVMFFDNVPTQRSILSDILPPDISKLLPSGSCVLISMRGYDSNWIENGVYERIQKLFPLSTCIHKVHEVKRLDCVDARNLFKQCAGDPPDRSSWSEIIHDLIDRCDGNPKLLILFGKYFRSQPRTPSFWKVILKKLEKVDDPSAFSDELLDGWWKEQRFKASNDAEAEQLKRDARFTAKLGLVYTMKLGECQDAMSDISSLLDGWNWNTVETILGKDILRKLKDQNFVSSKHIFNTLNNDLGGHRVCSSSDVTALIMNKCGRRSPMQLKVVQANSELRDTARTIHRDKHLQAVNTPMPKQLSNLQKGASQNLRSLSLVGCKGKFQLRWLDRIQGLHHLILHNIQEAEGVTVVSQKDLCFLYWGTTYKVRFPFEVENLPNLQTWILTDFDFSTQPTLEIPSVLQHLSLIRCRNVHLIAGAIFKLSLLKSLHLQECEDSCDLTLSDLIQPKGSSPFSLSFQNCAGIERIPAFVHKLQRLTELRFISCPNLKSEELKLQSVTNLKQKPNVTPSLKTVSFEDCRRLTCLPAELAQYVKSLTELEIRSCKVHEISAQIALFGNLTKLIVASCPALQTLPQEVGELGNLQRLSLEESRGLRTLPSAIGNLQFLEELKLDYCASLQALPLEVENLKRLSVLSMSFCYGFDPETDPSTLPNLDKLQDLRYVNLVGLEPASVLQKLADSTNSLRRSANERFTLIKDFPKRANRFSPFVCSTVSPTGAKEDARRYRSVNN